jgi:hypothetical protein
VRNDRSGLTVHRLLEYLDGLPQKRSRQWSVQLERLGGRQRKKSPPRVSILSTWMSAGHYKKEVAKTGTEVLSQRRKAGICQGEIRDDCPLGEATSPPSPYDVPRQQHDHPTASR